MLNRAAYSEYSSVISILTKCKMSRKSPVWQYFDISLTNQSKAVCKICTTGLSRGLTAKQFSTTPLINHLKHKHPDQFDEFTKKKESKPASDERRIVKAVHKTKVQPTLHEFEKASKPWSRDDENWVLNTRRLAEMIATDMEPYSIVDKIGFRRFAKSLQPKYEMPSRRYMSDTAIPEMYSAVRVKVKSLLAKADYVSFTTDIWTCSQNNDSYMSLTAHWINESYTRDKAVLHVQGLSGSHTADNIVKVLRGMLQNWALDDKFHLIVHDNGSNMVKATSVAKLDHLFCMSHTLQLVINDAIKSQRAVIDAIAVARKIVGHFKHSAQACDSLAKLQQTLQIPAQKLIQDVSTRWNSTYYMIERLLEQRKAIIVYMADHSNIASLKEHQWGVLEKLNNILKPFEEMTKELSRDTACASIVIPAVRLIVCALETVSDEGVQTTKAELLGSMRRRFGNVEENMLLTAATVLDPRYKQRFFKHGDTLDTTKDYLNAFWESSSVNTVITSDEQEPAVQSLEPPRKKACTSVWDSFSQFAATDDVVMDSAVFQSEFTRYLAERVIDRQDCPIKWWHSNRAQFPLLTRCALKFLSAPPTSVDSERAFSVSGNVCDDKRSRLGADNVEKLVFLHTNLKLIDYMY